MKNLTQGNIYKTFILFAIPLVLSGILSKGYTMVDTMIAGKFLGESGLAAIGATGDLNTFIISVFWGYGAGFTIYAAKLFGAENYKKMKSVVYSNLIVVIAASIVVTAIVVLFRYPILRLLKVDEAIMHDAARYLVIYSLGLFALTLHSSFIFVMNAMGMSSYPFIMSVISTILNISGNLFTVVVLKWGVAGVALSTVFAAVVTSTLFFVKMQKCFRELGDDKTDLSFKPEVFKRSFEYGMPTMLQQMIMYVAALLISPMVNSIGSAATASYSVATKIYDINAGIYQNSAKTLSNYTAQCIGARKKENLKKGVFVGWIQGMVLLSPVLLLCVIFAPAVCSAFSPETGGREAFNICVMFVKCYLPFILINLINNLFHSFFRGTASMKLLLSCTFVGAFSRLILSFVLAPRFSMHGIFMAWLISWVVEAVYCLYLYFGGKWKKDIE